ncbi:branched-chain amino acid ABC transporter permease [Ruegeria profundi]|uniref:Urea ABC transporter n=1 Tax=Ruegeria profundi TaxID=1685378 RepID=A0A0X3TRZ0_9RHOB|nr:urea ABC transporter [Ruegeria profundi]KUJ78477.1 urea ABC transporter [Ruegeria profundi]
MDYLAVVAIELSTAIATLVLIAAGLAIIFGMMRVINVAHGEFMMLGAYATLMAYTAGLNLWISVFIVAPLVAGIWGAIVEFLLIRRLYGRVADTLLATWGLSLFMIGAVTSIFGNTSKGIPTPLGAVNIGQYSISAYSLVLVLSAVAVLMATWLVLNKTRLGTVVRATIQNPDMAEALGVDHRKVYSRTFATGAAVAGLAGGVLAPISGVVPTMGAAFIAKAFITVISGGAAIVAGALSASVVFGGISQAVTFVSGAVWGEAMVLFVAVVILRVMPGGFSEFLKGKRS